MYTAPLDNNKIKIFSKDKVTFRLAGEMIENKGMSLSALGRVFAKGVL